MATNAPALLAEIAASHGVVLLVQFGSTVTGKTHERSDLDVGALFERFPGFGVVSDLALERDYVRRVAARA